MLANKSQSSSGEFCQVRMCGCGLYYLTIGAVTLKLSAEAFQALAATVGTAASDGVYVDASANCGVMN